MDFVLEEAVPVLKRTPRVLRELLRDLPEPWVSSTEGAGEWTPFDVLGHLIHGERADWMPRVLHLRSHGDAVAFPVFDREAMFEASRGASLNDLLSEFATLREESLAHLAELGLSASDLSRRGLHPDFGVVTLGQLLATWVAHDLGHIGQIVRTMAKQYTAAVGPWQEYLPVLASD